MQKYIGIDAHSKSCTVTVMGTSGRRLNELVIETDAKVLAQTLRAIAGKRHVVIEEGTLSDWLYEVLEPVSEEVLTVQLPRPRGNKSDSSDAWRLAEVGRVGSKDCVVVYKAPARFTALRKAVRAYQLTQRDLVRVKNRIHSCYRARGIHGLDASIYDPDSRDRWLKQLPTAQRAMTDLFCQQLDGLVEAHRLASEWLQSEARKVAVVQLLATAPGIGPVRAAQIVATIVSPHRFRTRSQLWAYCGLGITSRSSSDWKLTANGWQRQPSIQTRGLNRNRQPVLKNVFKGAAITIVGSHTGPMYESYQRTLEHTKPNLAQLTLARRIAATVLAMWKNNERFDPTRTQPAPR